MVVGSWPWGDTNGEMMTKTAKRYGTVSAALLMVAPSDLGDDITLASRHQRVVSLPPVLIWNKSKVATRVQLIPFSKYLSSKGQRSASPGGHMLLLFHAASLTRLSSI